MARSQSPAEALKNRIAELERQLESTEQHVESLEREKLFSQRLVDMAQAFILVLDDSGCIVWFNPHFSGISGYLLPDVMGKSWFSLFIAEADRVSARERFEKTLKEGARGATLSRFLTQTGQIRYVEWYDAVIRGTNRLLLCVGQDITEKRQMEEALVWQAQLNAALAELSTALIHPESVDHIAELVLTHACRLTQSTLGFVGYVEKKTGLLVCPAVLMPQSDPVSPATVPLTFSLSGGLRGWVMERHQPVVTNAAAEDARLGSVPQWHPVIERFLSVPALMNETLVGQISLANSCRDYSERDLSLLKRMASLYALALHHQQMDDTIELSEDRFKTIFRESPVGIRLYDMDGSFIDANRAYLEIFGFEDKNQLQVDNLFENPRMTQAEIERLDAGLPVRYEYEYRSASGLTEPHKTEERGEVLYLDITICRIGNRAPTPFRGYLSLTHDITPKKKTELALRVSEKKLRHLSSSLLKAQEQERHRISYALHDELGQSLAVLKLQISTALRRTHSGESRLAPECEAVIGQLNAIIENTRRLSRGLSPTVLDNLGLTAAIRWLVKEYSDHHDLIVRLELSVIDFLFPREAEIIIYRIIQESFLNIVKHSKATQVDLSIRRRRNRIRFYIADNGIGFDMTEVNLRRWPEKGLGLTAMEERARILGCPLRRLSRKGGGTRITFSVPIDGTCGHL